MVGGDRICRGRARPPATGLNRRYSLAAIITGCNSIAIARRATTSASPTISRPLLKLSRPSGALPGRPYSSVSPKPPPDLTEHLRRFPGSQFTPDALYWLGRLAEESRNAGLARSYYEKLTGSLSHKIISRMPPAIRLDALGVWTWQPIPR